MKPPIHVFLVICVSTTSTAATQVPHILATLKKIPTPSIFRLKPGDCDCLNWKNTYERNLVECGQGFEFGHTKKSFPFRPEDYLHNGSWHLDFKKKYPAADLDYCTRFYERLDDNACARVSTTRQVSFWHGQYWCYVSNACSVSVKNLLRVSFPFHNKTYAINNSGVRVKMCEFGVDRFLGDMSPPEFMNYSQRMSFWSPGNAVKLAYPFERRWFYKDRGSHVKELEKMKKNDSPVAINEIDEHGAKMILKGNKLWRIPNVALGFENLQCLDGC